MKVLWLQACCVQLGRQVCCSFCSALSDCRFTSTSITSLHETSVSDSMEESAVVFADDKASSFFTRWRNTFMSVEEGGAGFRFTTADYLVTFQPDRLWRSGKRSRMGAVLAQPGLQAAPGWCPVTREWNGRNGKIRDHHIIPDQAASLEGRNLVLSWRNVFTPSMLGGQTQSTTQLFWNPFCTRTNKSSFIKSDL